MAAAKKVESSDSSSFDNRDDSNSDAQLNGMMNALQMMDVQALYGKVFFIFIFFIDLSCQSFVQGTDP